MRGSVLGGVFLGFACIAFAAGSPFVGTYRGADIVIEIKESAPGQFAGTIVLDDEAAPFTAQEQEGALVGILTFEDETVRVRMTLKGATLTFSAGEESQTLTKQHAPPQAKPSAAAPGPKGLRVNGVVIDPERIRKFEQQKQILLPRGDFWYDKVSGAWGLAGGPTLGVTIPGMDLGGPLKEDASRGTTGLFINGRQLPVQDVVGLQSLGVPVQQGRWWLDHSGNFGVEGNAQWMGNIFQYSQGKGGAYQRSTAGGYIGGDGQTSYFFDPKTGSSVMTGP